MGLEQAADHPPGAPSVVPAERAQEGDHADLSPGDAQRQSLSMRVRSDHFESGHRRAMAAAVRRRTVAWEHARCSLKRADPTQRTGRMGP
jgi:hypothetical protein